MATTTDAHEYGLTVEVPGRAEGLRFAQVIGNLSEVPEVANPRHGLAPRGGRPIQPRQLLTSPLPRATRYGRRGWPSSTSRRTPSSGTPRPTSPGSGSCPCQTRWRRRWPRL
jgi:hypothetical protein